MLDSLESKIEEKPFFVNKENSDLILKREKAVSVEKY